MALIEIILGEHTPVTDAPIQYSIVNEGFRATINGEAIFEPVATLRDRFTKLKARDNLLGAVLARLGADPGARETEAHNAVGRLLADREAVSKIADCYVGAAEKIAQGLGLSATKPDDLAAQVLTMNTELSSALAKAQERIKELEGDAERLRHAGGVAKTWAKTLRGSQDASHERAEIAEAEVKALVEENAKLKAELGASAERQKRSDAALSSEMEARMQAEVELHDERISAKAEIKAIKVKLAEAELERMLAEATTDGMWTTLKIVERTLREKLRT